jgi:hypothetical protein
MEWVKKFFAVTFSTEFLKKILLIAAIFAVFNYLDRGLRISIQLDHSISSGYGGFEVKVKVKGND